MTDSTDLPSQEDGDDPHADAATLHALHPKLHELFTNLKEGGPPVDDDAVRRYVDDVLDGESKDLVAAQIVTWQDWYRAYWKAHVEADLEREKDGKRSDDAK